MGFSIVLTFLFIWSLCITGPAEAKVKPCRNTQSEQTQVASPGTQMVTFVLCISTPSEPGHDAFIHGVGWCRSNTKCGNKYMWTLQRNGSSNAFELTVKMFDIETGDYGKHQIDFHDGVKQTGPNLRSTSFYLTLNDTEGGVQEEGREDQKEETTTKSANIETAVPNNDTSTASTMLLHSGNVSYAPTAAAAAAAFTPSADCPQGWYLVGPENVTCAGPEVADVYQLAVERCRTMQARLLDHLDLLDGGLATLLTHSVAPLTLWMHSNDTDGTTGNTSEALCSALDASRGGAITTAACSSALPYLCLLDRASYEKPSITSMTIDVLASSIESGSGEEPVLLQRFDWLKSDRYTVFLTENGSAISVTCEASGMPKGEISFRSQLIGRMGGEMTFDPGHVFRYSRPDSFIGWLGSVSCLVSNLYGEQVYSKSVEFASLSEADITSFRTEQLQVNKGDSMTLVCNSTGFPPPYMRIVQLATGLPVKAKIDNAIEWVVPEVGCDISGKFLCQNMDRIGRTSNKTADVEVFQCPPKCPTNVVITRDEGTKNFVMSWKPGFNGGDRQTFSVFMRANQTSWQRFHNDTLLHTVPINASELLPVANYTFSVASWNKYNLAGEIDPEACRYSVAHLIYVGHHHEDVHVKAVEQPRVRLEKLIFICLMVSVSIGCIIELGLYLVLPSPLSKRGVSKMEKWKIEHDC